MGTLLAHIRRRCVDKKKLRLLHPFPMQRVLAMECFKNFLRILDAQEHHHWKAPRATSSSIRCRRYGAPVRSMGQKVQHHQAHWPVYLWVM
jgi:hypothetical protein